MPTFSSGPSDCRAFDPCWFRRLSWMFLAGLPLGLAFGLFGPVGFIRTLGAVAAVAALLGYAVSLIGIRMAGVPVVRVSPPPLAAA